MGLVLVVRSNWGKGFMYIVNVGSCRQRAGTGRWICMLARMIGGLLALDLI